MASIFTDMLLRKITTEGRARREIWDGRIPGFGLRISEGGSKTFMLVYRHRGRARRLTLGRYPFLSLGEAREKAAEALRSISGGADPALARATIDDPLFQFDGVLDRFVARHCQVHNKASTAKEHERLLRRHFASAWGKRDIRDITTAHINAILDDLVAAGTPSEANHALGVIKTLFGWCVERDLLVVSPSQKLKKPAKAGSRARTLSDDELTAVWQAAIDDGYPFGAMTQLLLLTGQRRGEVTNLRWSDIDLEQKTWTIPAVLAKNGRGHVLPLTATAIEMLERLPRLHAQLVFPARGNGSAVISGFTRAKDRLDGLSGVEAWTLHDLRRTVATGLAKLSVAPHVIERVLNHVSGSFAGVAGVYNRHLYLDEMRAALERWERHLLALLH